MLRYLPKAYWARTSPVDILRRKTPHGLAGLLKIRTAQAHS